MEPTAKQILEMRCAQDAEETDLIEGLCTAHAPTARQRGAAVLRAHRMVSSIRAKPAPSFIDAILAEYNLSTDEGLALMCLAESLLRVPDADTLDLLIRDKIVPANWESHLSQPSSIGVRSATRALMVGRSILSNTNKSNSLLATAQQMARRLGEPVARSAVKSAVRIIGRRFVHGRSIEESLASTLKQDEAGHTYSFDMLGEAAMTQEDATAFFQSYAHAIDQISTHGDASEDIHARPGISVKLSALDPSYDELKRSSTVPFVRDRLLSLCLAAKQAQIGLNVDAEEMNRLELSLDVLDGVIGHPDLAGWNGLGVVVQAYGKRAPYVIDWLYAKATEQDAKIMIRLVKGAYWDSEIKQAQQDGVRGFPVFTQKPYADVSYICCANKLLGMRDRFYPQFATHNAHSVASILELAGPDGTYEFQRLHGMGEELYEQLSRTHEVRIRVYAPVGPHRDLLAYLVRRLLENGANSSFVNQLLDTNVPIEEIAADPFVSIGQSGQSQRPIAVPAPQLFSPRQNSRGWDLRNACHRDHVLAEIDAHSGSCWHALPSSPETDPTRSIAYIYSPTHPEVRCGSVANATRNDVDRALTHARTWNAPVRERAATLERVAADFDAASGELIACLTREAGKTVSDAISEVREAVDFLRYYADQAVSGSLEEPLGTVVCISPWNFPLAIFTGQIAAALACGNGVIAKPAEQTPLIAQLAIDVFHAAGVPESALLFLPGSGNEVGAQLTRDRRVHGVCFTGSTQTAHTISRNMAAHLVPAAPLIAETGGINAMVVDSTCLLEAAVRDVVTSAFQSAGQRCSALRMLYVQQDIFGPFMTMLAGAMDELRIGDPQNVETDVGPVIDAASAESISTYVDDKHREGKVLKRLRVPESGHFVGPSVVEVSGIGELPGEIFGPVLHIAPYNSGDLEQVVDDINAKGYGLTFGIQSRIEERTQQLAQQVKAGNIYVNRNQIGAIVGSQPFGGLGLSGTGPKAGGPRYLNRLCRSNARTSSPTTHVSVGKTDELQRATHRIGRPSDVQLTETLLPGPTGELNTLTFHPRGLIICAGPSREHADEQADIAAEHGCHFLKVAVGASGENALAFSIDPLWLTSLDGFDGVAFWGSPLDQRRFRIALAERQGPILPLFTEADFGHLCVTEKVVSIDTTAVGGNADLLNSVRSSSSAP